MHHIFNDSRALAQSVNFAHVSVVSTSRLNTALKPGCLTRFYCACINSFNSSVVAHKVVATMWTDCMRILESFSVCCTFGEISRQSNCHILASFKNRCKSSLRMAR